MFNLLSLMLDSVQRLVLDSERRLLFSASLDKTIIVWSIKDQEFTSSLLYGHRFVGDTSLAYYGILSR